MLLALAEGSQPAAAVRTLSMLLALAEGSQPAAAGTLALMLALRLPTFWHMQGVSRIGSLSALRDTVPVQDAPVDGQVVADAMDLAALVRDSLPSVQAVLRPPLLVNGSLDRKTQGTNYRRPQRRNAESCPEQCHSMAIMSSPPLPI